MNEPAVKRFVLLGAGFWARAQLAAWGEQPGAVCVGVVDTDMGKAQALAATVGAQAYTDAAAALDDLRPDFADIVTPNETHVQMARLCLSRHLAAICQKPLAPTFADAETLVRDFAAASVPLLVHENWRWQAPLRAASNVLRTAQIGQIHRARIAFVCSFPVFDNQPALAELPRFIIADIGSHLLDVARFLFGEARSVYALTKRVNPRIAGEDVATVAMTMGMDDAAVIVEMSYASPTEREAFPQTTIFVEGDHGSLEITPGYERRVTDVYGTVVSTHAPPVYPWADPQYALVQSSMVDCLADLLAHLRGERRAETTGADNAETLRLVDAAYRSASTGAVVPTYPASFAAVSPAT